MNLDNILEEGTRCYQTNREDYNFDGLSRSNPMQGIAGDTSARSQPHQNPD